MYPKTDKPLPIDPAFDIRKHTKSVFSYNIHAYNNFAILMGKLNDAPCQCINYYYQDAHLLLRWLESTNINPVNVFVTEECLAFSRERKIKKWFAFLQKNVMIDGDVDFISINYTYQAGELVSNLCEYIQNLFQHHNSYAGKIFIMNEEVSTITMAKLKDPEEKDLKFSEEHENAFRRIVSVFCNKPDAQGVVIIAGENQRATTSFIKQLTSKISRRFVYVTQRDAPNIEYDFIDNSFGKGKNVFIVENAEEYPKIKEVFKESLAGYIQQLLKGKIKKAFNEPLIVIINGSLDEFPSLKNSKSQHVIAKIQF